MPNPDFDSITQEHADSLCYSDGTCDLDALKEILSRVDREAREECIEILCARLEREEYGHAKAAVALDIEAIRSTIASEGENE